MDARERMIRALAHKEGDLPDRVPTFVEGMMADFRRKTKRDYWNQMTWKQKRVNFRWKWALYYKFDSYWLHSSPVRMKSMVGTVVKANINKKKEKITRWGHIHTLTFNRETGPAAGYSTGYLNTKELWQEWIDAGYFDFHVDNGWIRKWEKQYPKMLKKDLVLAPVDTFFEKVREAFTFGKFSYFLRRDRPFMEDLTRRIFKMGMAYVKGVCDAGFEIATIADDTAYKHRVMYSPKIFEDLVVPHYKEMNDYFHKRGVLTFYHSDGYTEPYFPGLIKAGFNGIQSLEPAAGMDLKHLKETYGDKVALIGNLDCSRLLPFGSREDVRQATRQCLKDAMAGGGYICGPTTDIIDSCKPENILQMVATVHQDGYY